MKSMKNIKPAYAVQLGKGVFAGKTFHCRKCGRVIEDWPDFDPNDPFYKGFLQDLINMNYLCDDCFRKQEMDFIDHALNDR